ncbi:penicillin-binding transpeptidase domain-containing protein [Clostridium sp. DJ247]|uniref:penicillin-binding transpeptidase domain-containing protein n=1 Tax=Clostridium sp. DJ247 TaxID=2726188 RepID=UPI0016250D0D|nr:penicillin-binding transpeptidase domain-containing protein [Clostridium sp. DJ247]MBC2580624.1 penicillin-binding protein [Clostridium sp. DJ247]
MIKDKDKKFTRYTALTMIMIFIFTGIASKLFLLQIVKGAEYKEKADNKSIREIPDAAPRGNIIDKNGSILASSDKMYVLVYNQTDENDKKFFDTMDKVFKILDENGEAQQDDFELKVSPFRFEFRSDDAETKKALELRFKKDRGFYEQKQRELFKDKKELTKEDQTKIADEVLKITPEEVFNNLVKQYKIDSKYSLEQQRRFMIVKDAMKMQSFSGYKPIVVANNIKKETAFKFLQMLNDLPGIDVNTQPIRTYPNGELGSAFLGYISKITLNDDKDKDRYESKGYDISSDYIGVAGIESKFEDRLKGSKGGRIVKLNKQGRIIEELGSREPYPGQTIQLTIDKDVQAAAENALDKKMAELRANPYSQLRSNTANATRGAAAVIDVNTGAILALVSRPGYNPNFFAVPGGLSQESYNKFFSPDLAQFGRQYIQQRGLMSYYSGKSEEDVLNILFPLDKSIKNNTTIRQDSYDIYPKPFYNYATQSLVPPGSTFKPMTAIAGLETGVITPDYSVDDEGYFDKGSGIPTYFELDGRNGWVNLAKAIEKSSNPYFMTVGKLLRTAFGDDILAKYAWKFGLGADPNSNVKPATGIEIPENFGQVYNATSNKNLFANTYLWNTMAMLKNGSDNRGSKFIPIDLYDNDDDSDKVKALKMDIKTLIQNSIKEGSKAFDKLNYQKKLTDLTQLDPQYNGKSISTKEMNTITNAIYYITVSDANSQLRVGANIYDASIGQGMNHFTPIQMANYIATLANGGTRYKVHLVDKFLDANGKVIEDNSKPEVIEKTGVKPENIEAVKAGMIAVNEKGTAAGAFQNFPIKTAGKTGTASLTNQEAYGRTDYAEYVGFAPVDNPQIAVCVMIFDGGQGAGAAYVARDIYSAYFHVNDQNGTQQNGAQNSNESTNTQSNEQ